MTYFIRVAGPVVLSVLFPLFVLAQQPCTLKINGNVNDQETGTPIADVLVHIHELHQSVHTDSNGHFVFQRLCAGRYTLHIATPGARHITRVLNLSADQSLTVELEMFSGNVSVRTKKSVAVSSVMPVTELSGKELDRSQGQSLGEMLKGLPGVNAVQSGPTIFKPMIQGLYGSRILIFNNGVRQEDQQWGNEHAPALDPFMASRIRVVKGAYSLRYGPDAIGGIILVEAPAMPVDTGLHGVANLAGFSNNRGGAAALMLEYAHPKLRGFSFRAQGSTRVGGNSRAPDYWLANTSYHEYNYSFTSAWRRKDFEAQVYYSLYNTKVGILAASHIGNLTDLNTAINSDVPLVTSGFSYTIGRPYQSIQHELIRTSLTWNLKHVGKTYLDISRQYNRRNEFDAHLAYNDSLAALDQPQLHFELTTWTVNSGIDGIRVGNFRISTGLLYIHQKNTYEGRYFIPNFASNTGGVFIITNWRSGRWNTEAGLRFDVRHIQSYYWANNVFYAPERTFAAPSGALGASYDFNRSLRLKTSISSAFRSPGVNELYSNGLHHGSASVEVGDSTLTSEYALNINEQLLIQKKRWSLDVTVYLNHIFGYIYLKPVVPPTLTIHGAFPTFEYTQTNARLMGLDLALTDTITHWLVYNTRFSYVAAYDLTNKNYLVMIPPARWENQFRILFKDHKKTQDKYIGAGVLWVAHQHRVPPDSDYLPPPDAYALLSAEAGCRLMLGKQPLDLSLKASNLLNTSYRDYLNRFRYYADEVGRNIMFRMKIPF